MIKDWSQPDLAKDEMYCLRCGFIDKKNKFNQKGVDVCPLCKAYQFLVDNKTLPREKLFRKNYYGPYAPQQRCSRCGLILFNDNTMHTLQECDETLQQTFEADSMTVDIGR